MLWWVDHNGGGIKPWDNIILPDIPLNIPSVPHPISINLTNIVVSDTEYVKYLGKYSLSIPLVAIYLVSGSRRESIAQKTRAVVIWEMIPRLNGTDRNVDLCIKTLWYRHGNLKVSRVWSGIKRLESARWQVLIWGNVWGTQMIYVYKHVTILIEHVYTMVCQKASTCTCIQGSQYIWSISI